MRAVCESCAQPQPVDWRAGDLCVHCGLAVREEARCYWCAKWGPLAKFCRKCGAAAVAREHYGPARMLKHMGASVFEIPKLLEEVDPEMTATYQSIYGAHAAAAHPAECRRIPSRSPSGSGPQSASPTKPKSRRNPSPDSEMSAAPAPWKHRQIAAA